MKRQYFLFSCLALFLLFSNSAKADCIHTYSQNDYIHISRIDLNCKNIELVTSQQTDQGLSVSKFAEKYQTAVAINGSFFRKDGSPIGLNISNYKKWGKYQDTRSRSFLACNANNQCIIDPKNSLAKINPKWKTAIAGWHYYHQRSGKFECSKNDKIGCQQSIFTDKHPRTMIGLDKQHNWLYFVVVEGRQLTYSGMTMDELSELANKLQLTEAVNLDGGGSSTMVIGTKRVSDLPLWQGSERKVGNVIGVKLK
ncbi:phosphodiester glycosidase family protein [Pasteurellaceae bacterium 22721_9_1]